MFSIRVLYIFLSSHSDEQLDKKMAGEQLVQ
ncbi:hypothetical protein SAMN05216353_10289 [Halobacillus alkaliphilus]|uniref:Uncharacterized protein n=1 Tax=Halobacillus alkaliphilus TaxID=396056 RepID=A0A1I2JX14_9BACI|nr:hypothetical protein SAMN05216353_10289 [Halobacillus alkaliphilus]